MRVALAATLAIVAAAPAAAQTLTTIASNGGAGLNPNAPLLLGAHGKLYGTSHLGGRGNYGEVFQLTRPAPGQTAWTSTPIYQFGGSPDGADPDGGLTAGPNGVLYGVTNSGGVNNSGAVYQLTPPAAGQTTWTEQVLVSMPNTSASGLPTGTLAIDKAGNLYGVTQGFNHTGTVFEVSPPAPGQTAWSLQILYTFTGGADGGGPGANAGPLRTAAGVLYGTTESGGSGANPQGTIWRLAPPSKHSPGWTETTLATFSGANGSFAVGGLAKGPDGALYGTTSGGGATGNGEVYQLVPPAHGSTAYTLNVIWSFDTSGNGSAPESTPTIDRKGNIFATTAANGDFGGSGNGTIFRLAPPAAGNTDWQFTSLYSFPSGSQGGLPGQLTVGHKGVLYGATEFGGNGEGTAFQLTGSGYQ